MGKRLASVALLIILLVSATTAVASYRRDLNRATKTGRIYHYELWDANLIWSATLFTPAFRASFIDRHAEVEHLDYTAKELFAEEQWRKQDDGWEVFVSMYTKDRLKEFSMFSDSFWKALLTTESGETVTPISIEPVTITPYVEVMFPYIDRWSRTFRVVFPKVELGNKATMTLQSVVGDSSITWKIR